MKVKTYFYAALAFPFIGAALSFPLMFWNSFFAISVAALWFGGIPYAVFAILMVTAIRKIDELWKLHALVWCAPFLFLPFLALYSAVYLYISSGQFPQLLELLEFMQLMSIFALAIGFTYVVLFSLIYLFVPLSDLHHYKPDHNNGFNTDAGKTGAG